MQRTWLIDCDNTLYPAGNGLFDRVDARISSFMADMGISPDEIASLRRRYWDEYGVTLGGLIAEHQVDPEQYLSYVHDIELDDIIAPDPALADALTRLPGQRVIFTNGSTVHAERVLERLGIREAVGEIYDIGFMDYIPKPRPHGYHKLLKVLDVDPRGCVLVDDLEANLETGRTLGMVTVLVGGSCEAGHLCAATPHALPELALPTV